MTGSHKFAPTHFVIQALIFLAVLLIGMGKAQANTPTRIFWADCGTHSVLSSDLSGGDIQTVASGQVCATGIDVDLDAQKVYWVTAGGTGFRADFGGNNPQPIISGGGTLGDIEIDHQNGTFYWTDTTSQKIFRANLADATPQGQEVGTTLNGSAIALDPINSYIYFTRPSNGIYRVDYNGANVTPIITGNGYSYESIALDLINNDLYFKGGSDLRKFDLDTNTDSQFIGISGNSYGIEVDAANNAVYYTLAGDKTVNKTDLSGSSVPPLYTESSGSSFIYGISLGIPSAAPADTIPPDITCPANVSVSNDLDAAGAMVTFPEATASDAGGDVTIDYTIGESVVEPVEAFYSIGTTTITATATDTSDNTSSCTFDVIVNDTQDPTITCPETVIAEIRANENSATVTYGVAFSDNAPDAVLNQTQGLASGVTFPRGTTANAYTVTDASGNTASCQFDVVVQTDTTSPEITLVGDDPFTLEGGTTFASVDPGATAVDNVDGDISESIIITGTVDELVLDDYTVTYTITDATGNQASISRTVTVVDTTAPQVTINGDNPFTLEAATTINDPGVTVTDIVDPDPSVSVTTDLNAAVPGNYTVTYTVTDASGNQTIVMRDVTVVDTTPPVITLNGANPQSILLNGDYVEQGAAAEDSVDGDVSGSMVIDASAVDTSTVGSYAVTYNVSDNANNNADEVTRTVNVVEQLEPTITLLGANPQTIAFGDSYTELGATAQDNVGVDISGDIVIDTSQVNTQAIGSYSVTYTVTDDENYTANVTRTVDVTDQTAPIITLLGANPQQIVVNDPYTELGAEAVDDVDGDISGSMVIDASAVNTSTIGTYTVTYNVSDTANNAAVQVTRTVEVVASDNPAPEIVSTSPQNGAVDVDLGTNIFLELDEVVSPTGSGFVTFICQPNDIAVAFSVIASTGDSYTLGTVNDLPIDSTCTLSIATNAVSDGDGNNLVDNDGTNDAVYTLSFSTPAVPPEITNIEPSQNAANVPVTTSISITVSELPISVNAPVTLTCNAIGQTFKVVPSSAPRTFVLQPDADLPFDALCKLSITADTVRDASDNTLVDNDSDNEVGIYNLIFNTEAAPAITNTTPAANQAGVPTNTTITLETNEPLTGTGEATVTLTCGIQTIQFTISSTAPTVYVFTPQTALPNNVTCTLEIPTNAAADTDGNYLSDTDGLDNGIFVLTFATTLGDAENSQPAVEQAN